jgi:hypothetical protein
MAEHLGIGAMLGMLSDNGGTGEAVRACIGKRLASVTGNDELRLGFEDGAVLRLWDDGQSCCENRYMSTDDDLSYFVGAEFVGAEVLDAPNEPDEYGEHEVQFLHVRTSKGVIVAATHNQHNGYYGGFWIRAELVEAHAAT